LNGIPKPVKKVLRPLYDLSLKTVNNILDTYDIVTGKKNALTPPRNMIFIGDGDYEIIGQEFLKYFIEFGGIMPKSRILDIGCGIGRMAVPLTSFLSNEGSYYGFDIVEKGVEWCNKNISVRYPNFHFDHADIYNKSYNPKGKHNSSEYVFIYSNDFFDFAFLTSVFTHMREDEVAQYIKEISRVLKPKGICLITFFIINNESIKLVENKKASQNLKYKIDDHSYVKDVEIPESAIGFDKEYLDGLFTMNNMKIKNVYYGSWCGRNEYTSYQDIIVARKL
jgi:SAM-dependent methyltransferase